jgi:ribose transport system substrate-binding protein
MQRPATFAFASAALLGLASCGPPEKPSAPSRTIGASLLTMLNPFFKEIGDTMAAEGKKRGFEVIALAGELDPARQKDQVKDFLVKKVCAIVLTPCDSKSIGTSVAEANAAGVPVFTADVACVAPGARVVTHVATDNLEGGRLAGRTMAEMLGGKGKVALLDHPEVESSQLRSKGFREEIAKAPGISIVANPPGMGDKARSRAAAQDVLQAHEDIDGFFCSNDPSALGALAAIEEAGRAGRVRVIGFDGQLEARRAVKEGKLYATILQYPSKIGQMTVDAIDRYMKGEKVPPEMLIPTSAYRKAEAEKDPALK